MKEITDPSKLKVVELKAELSSRGLDTKGNKAVLVARLKEALEQESGDEAENVASADSSEKEDEAVESSKPVVSRRSPSPECIVPDSDNQTRSPQSEEQADSDSGEQQNQEENHSSDSECVLQIEEKAKKTAQKEPEKDNGDYEMDETEDDNVKDAGAKDSSFKMEVTDNGADVVKEHVEEEDPQMDVDDAKEEKDECMPEQRNKKSRWSVVAEDAKTEESSEAKEEDVHENREESRESKTDSRDSRERRRRTPSPRRRSRSPRKPDDEPEMDENAVLLSWHDSDLQLEINKDGFCSAKPVSDLDLNCLWAGARASYGVSKKKVCYEVKLVSNAKVSGVRDERNPYLVRVGWSVSDAPLQLGETGKSYGYDGTGRKAAEGTFTRYGRKFREGDVVGAYADLESDPIAISFTVNGANQGVAFRIPKDELGDSALFPHILTKNVGYEVNFGQANDGARWFEPRDKIEDECDDNDDAESVQEEAKKPEEAGKKATDKDEKENENGDQIANGQEKEDKPEEEEQKEKEDTDKNEEKGDKDDKEDKEEKTEEEDDVVPQEKEEKSVLGLEQLEDYVPIGLLDKEDRVAGLPRIPTREECEIIMMCGLPYSGKTHWVNEYVTQHPEKRYTILGTTQLLQNMTVSGKPRKNNHSGRWDVLIDRCTKVVNKLLEIASYRRRNYVLDQTNIFPSAQRRKMRSFEGFQRRAVVIVPSEEEYAKRQAKRFETDGKDVPDSAVLEMKANMSLPEKGDPFVELIFPDLNEEEARAQVEKYNKEGRHAGYGPQYSSKRPRSDWSDRRSSGSGGGGGGGWGRQNKRPRHDSRGPPNRWSQGGRQGGSGRHGGSGGGWGGGPARHGGGSGWGGPPGGSRRGPPPPRGGGWRSGGGGGGGSSGMNRAPGGGGSGGSGYNRNQSGGYNRRGGGPPGGNRNQGGNWGAQNNWGQGNWGGQGGHWGAAGGTGTQGNWSAYGNTTGQWKGYGGQGGGTMQQTGTGNSTQGTQQNAAQQWVGYPNYGWGNYYGQYAQGWGQSQTTPGGNTTNTSSNAATNQMYNQYTQQAWAQYYASAAQSAGGTSGGGSTTVGSGGNKKDDKKT